MKAGVHAIGVQPGQEKSTTKSWVADCVLGRRGGRRWWCHPAPGHDADAASEGVPTPMVIRGDADGSSQFSTERISSLAGQGARVAVTEIDPINALQALMDGFDVRTVEEAIGESGIVITATGNKDIITLAHMRSMKQQAILGNIGHFDDEIQIAALERSGAKRLNIKPQVDQWTFDDGKSIIVLSEGRLLNLGNATGHPSFVMSNSFSNQVIAQIELWTKNDEYDNAVYRLAKHLDEKVARIHVEALGGTLTKLTKEQAEYINVDIEGPYKPEHYRY